MKTIVHYQCEICGQSYHHADTARACEAKGIGRAYPIGLIYADHTPGELYAEITFAIAENHIEDHSNRFSSWACRDSQYGDSLGKEKCGGNRNQLYEHDAKINREHPTFKRLVAWLESQGIEPLIWDGTKAVPIREAVAQEKPNA